MVQKIVQKLVQNIVQGSNGPVHIFPYAPLISKTYNLTEGYKLISRDR